MAWYATGRVQRAEPTPGLRVPGSSAWTRFRTSTNPPIWGSDWNFPVSYDGLSSTGLCRAGPAQVGNGSRTLRCGAEMEVRTVWTNRLNCGTTDIGEWPSGPSAWGTSRLRHHRRHHRDVVGIDAMGPGCRSDHLVIAAAVTLTGVFRARGELSEPRPGLWPMRWMLLHDTVHARSSV
jgi:hypothetical protein